MNSKLIGLFYKALEGNSVSYEKIAEVAMQAGYVVDPKCSTAAVLGFLREQRIDPNSTFYKTWKDITSKTRQEIFIDQVKHYASTYGTLSEEYLNAVYTVARDGTLDVQYNIDGKVWTPAGNSFLVDWKKFKVIKAATVDEIKDSIFGMFKSGAALSQTTIQLCIEFLKDYKIPIHQEIDEVKNREAQAILAVEFGSFPSDEFGILRAIVYQYTGSTMLIKSREVINTIASRNGFVPRKQFDFAILSEHQLQKLSRIFYRYKLLFLAMKGYADNAKYINKIRRYAIKNHKPLKKGFWETCLTVVEEDVNQKLETAKISVKDLNNFRKVQLLQSILERLNANGAAGKVFVIRNGKVFVRDDYAPNTNVKYLTQLYNIIRSALVGSLKPKATTFMVPEYVNFTCPTSEKNFIGNYPVGTSISFGDSDNVLGIYWRNEWGTRDFDLHAYTMDGKHLGWNSSHVSSGEEEPEIIYSGDMTWADPEAVELLFFRKNVPDCIVNLSKFNGDTKSQYKIFVAKENMWKKLFTSDKKLRYDRYEAEAAYKEIMVDPNNIVADTIVDFLGGGSKTIAYVHNNKLHLMNWISGAGRIPNQSNLDTIQSANKLRAESYVDLVEILKDAGFTQVTQGHTDSTVEAKTEVRSVDVSGLSKEEAVAKVTEAMDKAEAENIEKEKIVQVGLDLTVPAKDALLKLFS